MKNVLYLPVVSKNSRNEDLTPSSRVHVRFELSVSRVLAIVRRGALPTPFFFVSALSIPMTAFSTTFDRLLYFSFSPFYMQLEPSRVAWVERSRRALSLCFRTRLSPTGLTRTWLDRHLSCRHFRSTFASVFSLVPGKLFY